jgi:gas vesicle protein
MDEHNNSVSNEEFLFHIIESLTLLAHKEASIFADTAQQIKHLIVDAVEKINEQFLNAIETAEVDVPPEPGHTTNLVFLLHKALDITNELNNKINSVVRAMQIDDIAGQLIDEAINRVNLNYETIKKIQTKIKEASKMNHEDKLAALKSVQQEIETALARKQRRHVVQRDLNEGSSELF